MKNDKIIIKTTALLIAFSTLAVFPGCSGKGGDVSDNTKETEQTTIQEVLPLQSDSLRIQTNTDNLYVKLTKTQDKLLTADMKEKIASALSDLEGTGYLYDVVLNYSDNDVYNKLLEDELTANPENAVRMLNNMKKVINSLNGSLWNSVSLDRDIDFIGFTDVAVSEMSQFFTDATKTSSLLNSSEWSNIMQHIPGYDKNSTIDASSFRVWFANIINFMRDQISVRMENVIRSEYDIPMWNHVLDLDESDDKPSVYRYENLYPAYSFYYGYESITGQPGPGLYGIYHVEPDVFTYSADEAHDALSHHDWIDVLSKTGAVCDLTFNDFGMLVLRYLDGSSPDLIMIYKRENNGNVRYYLRYYARILGLQGNGTFDIIGIDEEKYTVTVRWTPDGSDESSQSTDVIFSYLSWQPVG